MIENTWGITIGGDANSNVKIRRCLCDDDIAATVQIDGMHEILSSINFNCNCLLILKLCALYNYWIYFGIGLLSDTEYRPFWISWENRNLTVGTGWTVGENVVLYWHQDDMPIFSAVGFDTRDGTIGYWKIQKDRGTKFKCDYSKILYRPK